jgi:hypothetical protein
MDRIAENLIFEIIPEQFLYIGEDYLSIYTRENKKYKRIESFYHYQLMKLTDSEFTNSSRVLNKNNIGIILNSSHFIYNLLDFQKLPIQRRICDEMVVWRLKKIFPDNIENYIHRYYKLSSKRVISILLKNETYKQLDRFGIKNPGFIGNSTILTWNFALRRRWRNFIAFPDLVIETDNSSFVITAQLKGIPFYLRKFKLTNPERFKDEMGKILDFLHSTYKREMKTYRIINHSPDDDLKKIREGLAALNMAGNLHSFSECLSELR